MENLRREIVFIVLIVSLMDLLFFLMGYFKKCFKVLEERMIGYK